MEDSQRRLQHGLAHDLPPEYPEFQAQLNEICREYIRRQNHVWVKLIASEIDFNKQLEVTRHSWLSNFYIFVHSTSLLLSFIAPQEANDLLDRSIREIYENWVEDLAGKFTSMREIEQQLFDKMIETLVTYRAVRRPRHDVPKNLRQVNYP